MAVIKIKNSVPEIFVNESRDFQLFCALYTIICNDIQFEAYSIRNICDTDRISDSLLSLLASKLGFFSTTVFEPTELRSVLHSFNNLVRHKGSIKCIYDAVILFLKVNRIKSSVLIKIRNKENNTNVYKITIFTDKDLPDVSLLNELWKYLLPTGYIVEYAKLKKSNFEDIALKYTTEGDYADRSTSTSTIGKLRSSSDTYITGVEEDTIGAVDTFLLYMLED